MDALLQHCLHLARSPVGDDFAGEDPRYSECFEQIEQQLECETALQEGQVVDWACVAQLADELLTHTAKDLRVAAWYAWALQRRHAAGGLRAGVALLRALCEAHWEALHPRKPRTRLAAMGWLLTRLERWLEDLPPAPGDATLRALLEELEALDRCLGERLEDLSPDLQPLVRRLQQLTRESDTPRAVPQSTRPAAESETLAAPGNERDAHRSLRALQETSRGLCDWWREQGPADPRWMRLSRTLLWLPIDTLPAHDGDGVTSLRGLPAERLKAYRERLEQARYAELLGELEASIARAPFWLDGQRLVWECLQQLGAESAMRELEGQLAGLLLRLPGLERLSFHDATPFAEPATRAWLLACSTPAESTPPTEPEPPPRDAWGSALGEAQALLRSEGLRPAVRLLKQGLQQAQGGRERFLWRLAQARLCLFARQYELARTQLQALDQELGAVEQAWEPALLQQLLQLQRQCCEALPQNAGVREQRDALQRRLCCLDLEAVLE